MGITLSCAIGGERIARHNHVCQVIFETARQANLTPVTEMAGLLRNSKDRPADVFLHHFTNRRGTCVDFTCTNSLQEATVAGCADEGAYAVQKAHKQKLGRYAERCGQEGLAFLPMAVDTFGGWHEEALALITQLGRALACMTGGKDGEQVRHVRQRLGITLVRDNVAMLLARRPTFAASEVDGVEG